MDSRAIALILTLALLFFTIATPKVSTVMPNNGVNSGPISVDINGTKFYSSATVKLTKLGEEEVVASEVKVISGNKIVCSFDLKNKAIGNWDLVVTNKKIKSGTLKNAFTIGYPAPHVTGIDPKQSLNNLTVPVEISGVNFRNGATLMLTSKQMDIGATGVKVVSESKITGEFNLNQADIGVYNLKVINDDGKAGTLSNGFTIEGPPKPVVTAIIPTINAIDPAKGFNNGMVLTNITGTHFEPGSTVKLVGEAYIPGLNVRIESPTQISCFFDITGQKLGLYDVEVTNPSGEKAVLTGGFSVENFVPTSPVLNKALRPIYFDLNKATLRSDQKTALGSDLAILKGHPKLFILLGGHADERGGIEYNLELSAKRAGAIKKYLVEKGIDPRMFTIYAYGKEFPVVKGHSESSWWHNRRVDVMVWEAPPTKEQGIKEENKK